jgi:hypothetical protein
MAKRAYTRRLSNIEAPSMLRSFVSVGAGGFDVILTARQGAELRHRHRGLDQLCKEITGLLAGARVLEYNVRVRPLSGRTTLIQLANLDADKLAWVTPSAFLALEIAPANYEAWIAIPPGKGGEDFAARLCIRVGASHTEAGTSAVAGSLNFAERYAPAFPRVRIIHNAPGRMAGAAQLDAAG